MTNKIEVSMKKLLYGLMMCCALLLLACGGKKNPSINIKQK